MRRRKPESGFTLIETMLALTIFAVALTAIIQAIGLQVRTGRIASDTTRAVMLAGNLLDELRFSSPMELDEQSGEYDGANAGFSWSYKREDGPREGLDKYTVTVSWQDGLHPRAHVLEVYLAER